VLVVVDPPIVHGGRDNDIDGAYKAGPGAAEGRRHRGRAVIRNPYDEVMRVLLGQLVNRVDGS